MTNELHQILEDIIFQATTLKITIEEAIEQIDQAFEPKESSDEEE